MINLEHLAGKVSETVETKGIDEANLALATAGSTVNAVWY